MLHLPFNDVVGSDYIVHIYCELKTIAKRARETQEI